MAKSYSEVYEMLKAHGLMGTTARDLMREAFGHKVLSRIEDAEAEARDPKRIRELGKERDRRAMRLWADMIAETRKKRHNATQGAKDKPHEAAYFELLAEVCRRLEVVLKKAQLEARAHSPVLTPVQLGAKRGLPNSGLSWPDWIPDAIKAQVQVEAEKVAANRAPGQRLPRPFFVPEKDSAAARKAALHVALDQMRESAQERLRVLVEANPEPDVNKKRQITAVAAEITACDSAMLAIPSWPRTRPVPVHPLDLLGVRMPAILERVERISFEELSKAGANDCMHLASRCVREARSAALGRKRFVPVPSRKAQMQADALFNLPVYRAARERSEE